MKNLMNISNEDFHQLNDQYILEKPQKVCHCRSKGASRSVCPFTNS